MEMNDNKKEVVLAIKNLADNQKEIEAVVNLNVNNTNKLIDSEKEIKDYIDDQIDDMNTLMNNQKVLELNELGNEYKFKFIKYLFLSSTFIVGLKNIELSILLLINFIIFLTGMKNVENKIFNAIKLLEEESNNNNNNEGDED